MHIICRESVDLTSHSRRNRASIDDPGTVRRLTTPSISNAEHFIALFHHHNLRGLGGELERNVLPGGYGAEGLNFARLGIPEGGLAGGG